MSLGLTDELRKILHGDTDEDIQVKQNLLEEVGVKEAGDLQYLSRQALERIAGLKTIDRSKILNYIKIEYGDRYREMEQKNEKDREHKVWHAQVEKKKSELEERIQRCLYDDEDYCKESESTSFNWKDFSSILTGGNIPEDPKLKLIFFMLMLLPFGITILLDLSNAKNSFPKVTLMIDIGFSAFNVIYISKSLSSNAIDCKKTSKKACYRSRTEKLIILASGILAGSFAKYLNAKQSTAIAVGISTAAILTAAINIKR